MPKVPHNRNEHPQKADRAWWLKHIDVQHDVGMSDDISNDDMLYRHLGMHQIDEQFHDRRSQ